MAVSSSSSFLMISCLTAATPFSSPKIVALKARAQTHGSSISFRALHPPKRPIRFSFSRFLALSDHQRLDNEEDLVQDLRVPKEWLDPSRALQESDWLRVTLHKWLDDEYCAEATNIDISKVAARSYYESLVGQQRDLGKILLKMARDLESISYQESFHGAFTSANAAVHLITLRMEQE